MGLAGGAHGPKAALRQRYPNAWETARDLPGVSRKTNSGAKDTLSCVDGNVCAMAVPQSITRLDEFTTFLLNLFMRYASNADNVVVVLDDPATLTQAKRAEQCRRDAMRRKPVPTSSDLAPRWVDDDFDTANVGPEEDVRALIADRNTRMRIMDHVFSRVFLAMERHILARGEPACSFSVVGCDPRGGRRPIGALRKATVLSTDDGLGDALLGVTAGEGDLKLTQVVDVAIRERDRAGSPLAGFKTAHLHTIDTDSILIEMGAEARRIEEGSLVNTFLVFKERAPKRGSCGANKVAFNLLDVSTLLECVCEDVFGMSCVSPPSLDPCALSLPPSGILIRLDTPAGMKTSRRRWCVQRWHWWSSRRRRKARIFVGSKGFGLPS